MYSDKEVFERIATSFIKRKGIDNLLFYLENDTDFYTAPCSTRYHLSVPGGLCRHSINVYNCLMTQICANSANEISDETAAIVALFHDLCKVNYYELQPKWAKDDNGQWYTKDAYVVNEKFPFGHGEKSVFIVQKFLDITDYEAQAINAHMGFSDERGVRLIGNIFAQNKLALLLHFADMTATYIKEKEQ